jgi:hypothetical protein
MTGCEYTLEDYKHPTPEKGRNWRGTGKCNPNIGAEPCVLCWGENVMVKIVKHWKKGDVVVVEELKS